MLEKIRTGLGGSIIGICMADLISNHKEIHYVGAFLGFVLSILIIYENNS